MYIWNTEKTKKFCTTYCIWCLNFRKHCNWINAHMWFIFTNGKCVWGFDHIIMLVCIWSLKKNMCCSYFNIRLRHQAGAIIIIQNIISVEGLRSKISYWLVIKKKEKFQMLVKWRFFFVQKCPYVFFLSYGFQSKCPWK